MSPTATSAEITRKAKSNLAFALATLPKERRQDMVTFYAFCRVIDDIADDPDQPVEAKKAELAHWRAAVLAPALGGTATPELLAEVNALPAKHGFERELLAEIIDGVASDQDRARFATFAELKDYCYKVACVVGIVSAHIFGATHPQSRDYAIALGYALQLTNILRDVGQDARDTGRIYLPQEELAQFGVSEADLLAGKDSPAMLALFEHQFQRAQSYYDEADRLLPAQDKQAMIAARMMSAIYSAILQRVKRNGYRVLHQRERLSALHKLGILGTFTLRGWLGL